MRRKTKATTVEGALKAFRAVSAPPLQPPYPLSDEQRLIWSEVLSGRSRDEWKAIDLRFAWELSDILVKLRREDQLLTDEGYIIFGERGSKANPRGSIVQALSRRAVWLATYLRVNPAAEAGQQQQVTAARTAERAAKRAMMPPPAQQEPDFLAAH
jgi:hypothetical protein